MRYLSVLFVLVLIGCSAPPASGNTAQTTETTVAQIRAGKPGPVGEVTLTNDSHNELPARTFSFGQVFRRGEVAVGEDVQVTIDGQPLPTQIDAKALNPDGSVRHAIVTVALPDMSGKQTLKATLVNNLKGTRVPPGATVAVPDMQVTLAILQPSGQKQTQTLDLPSVVRADTGKPDYWLRGPLAQERRYAVQVTNHLQVLFDVYTPRSGPSRVDVIFCNDWNDLKAREDKVVYDVAISMAGRPVYREKAIEQPPFTTWHYLAWSDGTAAPRTSPSLAGLIAAAAVPRYDEKFHIGSERETVTEQARALPTNALNSGSVVTYMPMTGGRFDIGPLPTWAVVDLLDGDPASRRLLLANADAAGSIPWHVRERTTSLPLTADKYPDLWLDGRETNFAPLAEPFHIGDDTTKWAIDTAHMPSLTYLPYLITGLRYYKDELAQQAAYVLLSYNSGYRGGAAALIDGVMPEPWFEQRRGIAWSFRTLGTAAYAIPTDDPLHAYFDAKLRGNLAHLVNKYITAHRYAGAGPVEGYIPPTPVIATWQQGFMTISLGWINDMGYPDAGRFVGWMSNFMSGLFTSKSAGFDPRFGTSYVTVTTEGDSPQPLPSWKAVFEASDLRQQKESDTDSWWDWYGMIMRAALASAHAVDHQPRSKEAFDYVTKYIGEKARGGDPTFAIVPP